METVCYEIKPVHKEFPMRIRCPHCSSILKAQDVQRSQAGMEYSENMSIACVLTRLFHCVACGWWAVLEQRSGDYELYYVSEEEFIVMGDSTPGEQTALKQDEPPPWEWALNHDACWQTSNRMPRTKVVQMFGFGSTGNLAINDLPRDAGSSITKLLLGALFFILLVSYLAEVSPFLILAQGLLKFQQI